MDSFFTRVPKQCDEVDKENVEIVGAAGDNSQDTTTNKKDKDELDDIVENDEANENIDHIKKSNSNMTITFDSEITLSQQINENKTVDIVFDNIESLSQCSEVSNDKKAASTIVFDDYNSLSQHEKRNSSKETIFDDFNSLSQTSKSNSNKKSAKIIFDDFQSFSQEKPCDSNTGLKISFDNPETLSQNNSNIKLTFDDAASLSQEKSSDAENKKSSQLGDSKLSPSIETSNDFKIEFDNLDTFSQAKTTIAEKDNSGQKVTNSIEVGNMDINIDDSKLKTRKEVNISFSMDKMKSSLDAIKKKDEEDKETELKFSAKINPQVKN